jgi:hypothetical protein
MGDAVSQPARFGQEQGEVGAHEPPPDPPRRHGPADYADNLCQHDDRLIAISG